MCTYFFLFIPSTVSYILSKRWKNLPYGEREPFHLKYEILPKLFWIGDDKKNLVSNWGLWIPPLLLLQRMGRLANINSFEKWSLCTNFLTVTVLFGDTFHICVLSQESVEVNTLTDVLIWHKSSYITRTFSQKSCQMSLRTLEADSFTCTVPSERNIIIVSPRADLRNINS